MMLLGAGNVTRPGSATERFGRDPADNQPISFGAGRAYCRGRRLRRLEATTLPSC